VKGFVSFELLACLCERYGCDLVACSPFSSLVEVLSMGKYRGRLQIIADVLSVVRGGARKTMIMYQANLSYKLLTRYLEEVLETGLVELGDDDCFELTQKGKEFLDKFDEYFERRRSVEERLNDVMDEKMFLEDMLLNAKVVKANHQHNRRDRKKK